MPTDEKKKKHGNKTVKRTSSMIKLITITLYHKKVNSISAYEGLQLFFFFAFFCSSAQYKKKIPCSACNSDIGYNLQ